MIAFRRFVGSQFNQDVLWNVASLGILALGGVIVNLIIVRMQGQEALGVFNQVYAVYIVLSQIGVGGLQHSVLKHISYYQDDRARCADITTAALLLITAIVVPMGAVCLALAAPLGDLLDSSGVAQGVRLVIPGLLFFAWNKVLINALNGLQRMRAYAVFRSVRFVLIPLLVVVIAWRDLDAPYLLLSLTFTEMALFVVLAGYVYGRLLPVRWMADPRARFGEHISFGVRGVLSGILTELNTRVDVLMLGYFASDDLVGTYSFAAMLAEGVSQLPLALRWNIDPIIGRFFAQGEPDRVTETARRIRRGFYPLMAAVSVTAVLVYPVLLAIWLPGDGIGTSWALFSIMMAGVLINGGYRPFLGTLFQGGRPGAHTALILALVANDALLNLVFIPWLGVYGAAIVTMLTYALEAVGLVILVRRLFGIRL